MYIQYNNVLTRHLMVVAYENFFNIFVEIFYSGTSDNEFPQQRKNN